MLTNKGKEIMQEEKYGSYKYDGETIHYKFEPEPKCLPKYKTRFDKVHQCLLESNCGTEKLDINFLVASIKHLVHSNILVTPDLYTLGVEQLYHVITINPKQGKAYYMTSYPMIKKSCLTMIGKMTDSKDSFTTIQEVTTDELLYCYDLD